MVYRIFVEKKPGQTHEADKLLKDVQEFLQIASLKAVRVINRYDVENIEYNFAISVLSLVLTLILSLPALLTFLASNEFPNGIFGFLVGVVVYFVLFVLSLFTTVTSLIGFLLGHSSIKGFETKRKKVGE